MPAIRLARHPVVHPNGLTARAGLVLLAALASVLVAGRLQVPPAVRTTAVGRVPTALVVDALTRHVFVANRDSTTVSMLDAASGAVLATVAVPPIPVRWPLPRSPGARSWLRFFLVMAPDAAQVDSTNERLVELTNKNDPTNLFRLNQNIKPSVWRHSEGGTHDRLTRARCYADHADGAHRPCHALAPG